MSQEKMLQDFAEEHLKKRFPDLGISITAITKMFGQASARQYFRVNLDIPENLRTHSQTAESAEIAAGKALPASVVIMLLPGGATSPAEEISKGPKPEELPFLAVQKYLLARGLPVPQILGTSEKQDMVLLEDLGDKSLEALVVEATSEFKGFYYRKVIDTLVAMQTACNNNPDKNGIAFNRSFDADLLNWEFDHFWEYGIIDRLGITPNEGRRDLFVKHTRAITEKICAMPQGFVHRDFQSRNILFHNYEFYLIDFQDALIGPVLYDLVALLRDSYIAFSSEETHALLHYFSGILPQQHPYHGRHDDLVRDFNLITLQRKLKDAGRFQYIKTVRGNPNFLVHIPQTLEYIRDALKHLPEHAELFSCIADYLK